MTPTSDVSREQRLPRAPAGAPGFSGKRRLFPSILVVICATVCLAISLLVLFFQQSSTGRPSSLAAILPNLSLQSGAMGSTLLIGIALLPIVLAAVLFWGFQRNGREVGLAVLSITLFVTLFVPAYRLGTAQLFGALGGGLEAAFILASILFPALLFYRVQQQSGAIESLFRATTRFLPSLDSQMLVLVLGVGPCLESCCGFGIGALVILPFLIRIYDQRIKAAALSLLSLIISPWGSSGLGTSFAVQMSSVPPGILSSYTALMLIPPAIGLSLAALILAGGKESLERSWLMALVSGGTLMAATCLLSRFLAYETAGLLASLLVIAMLFLWGYTRKRGCQIYHVGLDGPKLGRVLVLYGVLLGGITVTHVFSSWSPWLQEHAVLTNAIMLFRWSWLSSPGIWLLVCTLLMFPLFSVRILTFQRACKETWVQFFPAVFGLCAFLLTAALLEANGMADALESLLMHLGKGYIWLDPLVSALAGWLMNSFVGGTLLIVPMQITISAHSGLPLPWMLAAQEAAIALASAVSPLSLLLIATAAGITRKEGRLLNLVGGPVLWGLILITFLLVWFVNTWPATLVALLFLINAPLFFLLVLPKGRMRSDLFPEESRNMPLVSQKKTRMGIGLLAYGALVGVNLLYSSFSLVSMGPISHIDPIVFLCLSLLLQLPIALLFLIQSRRQLTSAIIKYGMQIGVAQGVGLLCFMVALARSGITDAAICSCLNGVAATFAAWLLFKQRPNIFTWCACLLATGGGAFIWYASPGQIQGDFTAFLGGSLFTVYAFLIERMLTQQHVKNAREIRAVTGVILATMVSVAIVAALAFGEWKGIRSVHITDMLSIVYVSFAAILLPLGAELFILRHVSVVTMSFFMILEPLASASFGYMVGERLPFPAYVGAVFVLLAVVLQSIAGARSASQDVHLAPVQSDAA